MSTWVIPATQEEISWWYPGKMLSEGKCGASPEKKVIFTCWSLFFNIFNIWVSWEQTAWWSSTQMATAFSARLQKWDMQTHLSSLAFGMWRQCLKISWVVSQFSFFFFLPVVVPGFLWGWNKAEVCGFLLCLFFFLEAFWFGIKL